MSYNHEKVNFGLFNAYKRYKVIKVKDKNFLARMLELVLKVVARTTSIVLDLMQCFASNSHDTVAVMFGCV